MLELTTYTELELAHRLGGAYSGRCLSLHGHRYEIEITVSSEKGLNKDGMIVDFKKLKEVVKVVLDDEWDHASCFRKDDPIGIAAAAAGSERVHLIDANPTLEWMVDHWAYLLQRRFDQEGLGIVLTKLTASETARNTVTWHRDAKVAGATIDPNADACDVALPKARICSVAEKKALTVDDSDDSPDAVQYLVAYKDALGIYSAIVKTAYTGVDLVKYCTAEVTKEGAPVGSTTVLAISRLPA